MEIANSVFESLRSVCALGLLTSTLSNDFQALARELLVWSRMKHPNILGLEGFAYDENDLSIACIVTRWQENGNVFHYVSRTKPDLYRRLELVRESSHLIAFR